jgi:hypothetical protein
MSNGPKLGMQMTPCLSIVLRPILTPKLRPPGAARPPMPAEPWRERRRSR